MTTPRLSHQIPNPEDPSDPDGIGRMYSRQPGGTPEVPSITTIIDVLNSHMEWWRGLCAGKEAIKQAPLIVARMKEFESKPDSWRNKEKQIVKWIDEAAVRDMKVASQRGDVVHDYAEKVCRSMMGESFDLKQEREEAMLRLAAIHNAAGYPNDTNEGFFNAVHRFLSDFKVQPVAAEGTVWNSEVGYAGTNDLLCIIDGRLTLLDWKTKKQIKDPASQWYKPSIKTTIALQLEAARRGEEMYSEVTGEWTDWKGRDAVEQVGVAIGPNGYEAMRVIQRPDTWETFKALRIAWGWYMEDKIGDNKHLPAKPMSPQSIWN